MSNDSEERWKELCEQASKELDPQKLMELSVEINRLLEERENRPKADPPKTGSAVA